MAKKRLTKNQKAFLTGLNKLMVETGCSTNKNSDGTECICFEDEGEFVEYKHTGTDDGGCPLLGYTVKSK